MTRGLAEADDVRRLMRALGRAARGPGRVFVTGGATAVLKGWRSATADVEAMLRLGLIDARTLRELFEAIEPRLIRFPSIDPVAFRRRLDALLGTDP
jgi:hypothetical protein